MYELRLYFAETTFGETSRAGFGGESTRIFDVLINGKAALKWLDVVGEAGASAANIKMFKDISPDADGKLHLSFMPQSYMPFLNAIEITPGVPGKMQRIRMVAQSHGYIDKTGHYWEPDRYGTGGQLVKLTARSHRGSRSGYLRRWTIWQPQLRYPGSAGTVWLEALFVREVGKQ